MKISHIQLENFRNFHRFDVPFGDQAVIATENRVGKSNLLSAPRLILDPAFPDAARQLRIKDFWDGLARPLNRENRTLVAVGLADFETGANLLAGLAKRLVRRRPMITRLTCLFRPLPTRLNTSQNSFALGRPSRYARIAEWDR